MSFNSTMKAPLRHILNNCTSHEQAKTGSLLFEWALCTVVLHIPMMGHHLKRLEYACFSTCNLEGNISFYYCYSFMSYFCLAQIKLNSLVLAVLCEVFFSKIALCNLEAAAWLTFRETPGIVTKTVNKDITLLYTK